MPPPSLIDTRAGGGPNSSPPSVIQTANNSAAGEDCSTLSLGALDDGTLLTANLSRLDVAEADSFMDRASAEADSFIDAGGVKGRGALETKFPSRVSTSVAGRRLGPHPEQATKKLDDEILEIVAMARRLQSNHSISSSACHHSPKGCGPVSDHTNANIDDPSKADRQSSVNIGRLKASIDPEGTVVEQLSKSDGMLLGRGRRSRHGRYSDVYGRRSSDFGTVPRQKEQGHFDNEQRRYRNRLSSSGVGADSYHGQGEFAREDRYLSMPCTDRREKQAEPSRDRYNDYASDRDEPKDINNRHALDRHETEGYKPARGRHRDHGALRVQEESQTVTRLEGNSQRHSTGGHRRRLSDSIREEGSEHIATSSASLGSIYRMQPEQGSEDDDSACATSWGLIRSRSTSANGSVNSKRSRSLGSRSAKSCLSVEHRRSGSAHDSLRSNRSCSLGSRSVKSYQSARLRGSGSANNSTRSRKAARSVSSKLPRVPSLASLGSRLRPKPRDVSAPACHSDDDIISSCSSSSSFDESSDDESYAETTMMSVAEAVHQLNARGSIGKRIRAKFLSSRVA